MGASTKVTQMHMEPSDDEDEETGRIISLYMLLIVHFHIRTAIHTYLLLGLYPD